MDQPTDVSSTTTRKQAESLQEVHAESDVREHREHEETTAGPMTAEDERMKMFADILACHPSYLVFTRTLDLLYGQPDPKSWIDWKRFNEDTMYRGFVQLLGIEIGRGLYSPDEEEHVANITVFALKIVNVSPLFLVVTLWRFINFTAEILRLRLTHRSDGQVDKLRAHLLTMKKYIERYGLQFAGVGSPDNTEDWDAFKDAVASLLHLADVSHSLKGNEHGWDILMRAKVLAEAVHTKLSKNIIRKPMATAAAQPGPVLTVTMLT